MAIANGQPADASDFVSISSGAADAGKVPLLNADGVLPEEFLSLNRIISYAAGEALDGSVTPVCVAYDAVVGRIRLSRANVASPTRNRVLGFIRQLMTMPWPTLLGSVTFTSVSGFTGNTSFAYTLPAGDNRCIVFSAVSQNTPTYSGATWNGQAMTLIATVGNLTVWVYMAGSSASSTAGTIALSGTASSGDFEGQTYAVQDVDQASPLTKASNSSASTLSVSAQDAAILIGAIRNTSATNSTGATQASAHSYGLVGHKTWLQNIEVAATTAMTFSGSGNYVLFELRAASPTYPPADVITSGVVPGFSGLSIGATYYLQDAGGIATTAGTGTIKVGIAVSATELLIDRN